MTKFTEKCDEVFAEASKSKEFKSISALIPKCDDLWELEELKKLIEQRGMEIEEEMNDL